MSSQVFPTLPGLSWSSKKTPQFKTIVKEAMSGKEVRASYMANPIWNYDLSFEVLRETGAYTEMQTLCGLFLLMRGSFDDFLFTDPDHNSLTAQSIGTGNGSKTQFQITHSLGGFAEPIQNLNGSPSIYLNGVLQTSGYSVGSTGIVTFTTAPGSGVAVTVTTNFYYRVRFKQDLQEFEQFMRLLWLANKVQLRSVKL